MYIPKVTSKTPKIRFTDFENDWELHKLSELCMSLKSGKGITSKDIEEHGLYPVYGGNGLRGYTNTYTHDGTYVLIGRQGALCGNINLVNGKNYISEHAIVVAENKRSDINWLSHKLKYMKLNRYSESSAQPGLSVAKISKIKLYSPKKQEQQRIASFLTSVDNWIENLEKQKNSLKEYKKGIMQKIFSQEIRFKDKNGCEYPEWEKIKLRKLSKVITKGTTPTSLGFSYLKEGVNFIKAENINQYSEISISETMKVSSECNQALSRSSLEENDILFSIAGTLGRTAIVKKKDLPANTNQALAIIRLNSTVDVFFIEKFLNSQMIEKYILQMLSVGAQPNLSLKQVGNIEVKLPSIKEQMQIASFLFSIENLVESKSNQINKAKEWKKGLLQQMFV